MNAATHVAILLVAIAAGHVAIRRLRGLWERLAGSRGRLSTPKVRTIAGLLESVLVFVLYFAGAGLVLDALGIPLTAYLAGASVIGLAVGFGSQGFVQDVVTGLTLLVSDLLDVGDMVEIGGQTGVVQHVGLRFTTLVNALGAEVAIPNRMIGSVAAWPRGYVRCLADVTLPADPERRREASEAVAKAAATLRVQFPGVVLTEPSVEGELQTPGGRQIVRIKFRLWPGRGDVVERCFKPEVVHQLRQLDPGYAEWMVAVNFEVEERGVRPVRGPRRARA